jgi:drug/metabolite transporter (DMT)-like permease
MTSDPEPLPVASGDSYMPLTTTQIDQLKQIYDYAKFHIGLYATVSTALIAVISFVEENVRGRYFWCYVGVLGCFLLAGVGGGLVASHIVYTDWDSDDAAAMLKEFKVGTLEVCKWNRYKVYSLIEHYAFWAGILWGIVCLLCKARG